MFRSKGQASLIDILILATAISIFLIYGTFLTSNLQISMFQQSFESIYSQGVVVNVLNFYTDYNGADGKQIRNISFNDLVGLYYCGAITDKNAIESKLSDIVRNEVPQKYSFIYYITNTPDPNTDTPYNITAWNKQPSVCGKAIALASYMNAFACPDGNTIVVTHVFGMWPEWVSYPERC